MSESEKDMALATESFDNSIETLSPDLGLSEFESELVEMDASAIDEFSTDELDYDNMIVVSKGDLANFLRIIEPLNKVAVDEYSKSVHIRSVDNNTVELIYVNEPSKVRTVLGNKSGKMIDAFSVSINNLKKFTQNAFASLVFVQTEEGYHLSICGSLLYIETKPLQKEFYDFETHETTQSLDKERGSYAFKKIGAILSMSERVSEKVIVIQNNCAYYNTGFFVAKVKSPFGDSPSFVLYKSVTDVLGVLSDLAKADIKYTVDAEEGLLYVFADGATYLEMPIGPEDKVVEFYSPGTETLLKFDADIVVVNDSIFRLISLVKALDYLSDIVAIEFQKTKMLFTIFAADMQKPSVYEFPIIEGTPLVLGEMRQNADVLNTFLSMTGQEVKYSFNEDGFGINNEQGSFLIRRT